MVQILFILTFIISLASAAYGLLLSNELRKKNNRIYTAVLFQQLLIHVFILYGIWGQVVSTFFLQSEFANNPIIEKFSSLILLLAIPFLLASWWFLLYISLLLKKGKRKQIKALTLLILSVAIITTSIFTFNAATLLENLTEFFFYENLVLSAWIAIQFISTKNIFKDKRAYKLKSIAFLILSSGVVSISIYFRNAYEWVIIIFIISFSIYNVWLPITFKYFTTEFKDGKRSSLLNFKALCEKYGITKRECEIINLVCEGKTNKEIADLLFITLQTVKDHTSRIYLKTQVKNRTQLANLVR
ncbi:MAG: LuxR C-terminal-related transcriptional regulator [Prolixibacteraceae bacterium]|jgi:DNA-binding CsgD family transcriptional regulator|nr:LuxR C-terminal-related transcriptional regulator [Prolixibacteraceae bacterium]